MEEAKALPCTQRAKTDCISRVRRATTCWLCCFSPRLVQHHTKSWYFFQWERKPRVDVELPQYCGLLLRSLHSTHIPQGMARECLRLSHWESDGDNVQREAHNSQHLDLDRLSSYLQHPSRSPNQWLCSSVEPRWWCSLTSEHSRVWFCLTQVLKELSFPATRPSPTQAWELSHSLAHFWT